MTKKSLARRMRDADAKQAAKDKKAMENNTCWDDLNNIYTSCVQLLKQHGHLGALAANKELLACVTDPKTLATTIRQLSEDIRTMSDELNEIRAQHKDLVGGSKDPDEVIRSITISEQYHLFMERHNGVILPTAYHIIEQFDQAEQILKLKQWNASVDAKGAPTNPVQDQRFWCEADQCYYQWKDGIWLQDKPTDVVDVEILPASGNDPAQQTLH